MPSEWELLLRLLLASALGAVIGLERELSGQGAGFRTHILVALGAALFTLVSAYAFGPYFVPGSSTPRFDPTRIAAQVVSGIGFLGGGAILRSGTGVRGLTTAASLWVVAAIGMAAAAGFYGATAVTAALAVASLWGLKRVRRQLVRELRGSHLELTARVDAEVDLTGVVQRLGSAAERVNHIHVETGGSPRTITVGLRLPVGEAPEEMAARVGAMPGVRDVEWSR
jgi:putative Mg2+ transporter-C (MgtC) family protein